MIALVYIPGPGNAPNATTNGTFENRRARWNRLELQGDGSPDIMGLWPIAVCDRTNVPKGPVTDSIITLLTCAVGVNVYKTDGS